LDKDAFIGTAAISSVIVDFSRLLVYGITFYSLKLSTIPKDIYGLVGAAALAALIGSIVGTLIIKKITLRIIQLVISVMLIIVGIGIISGLI
ncbi:MAG: sulfite exporter TauE/SafE family protein, partial [Nitrososphaeraceae archaeon]